jgi:hypothetical protein
VPAQQRVGEEKGLERRVVEGPPHGGLAGLEPAVALGGEEPPPGGLFDGRARPPSGQDGHRGVGFVGHDLERRWRGLPIESGGAPPPEHRHCHQSNLSP